MTPRERNRLKKHIQKSNEVEQASMAGMALGTALAQPVQQALHMSLNSQDILYGGFEKGVLNVKDLAPHFGKEEAKLIESFIKEKGLREGGLEINLLPTLKDNKTKFPFLFSGGDDYYNTFKHTVNVSSKSPAVILHELGHAHDIKGSIPKILARNMMSLAPAVALPVALMHGDEIKKNIPGTLDDKVITLMQNNPVTTALTGYTARHLYPEAKASYYALKHVYDKLGTKAFLKTLGALAPAYGTYAVGALPLAGAAYASKKWADKLKKEASLTPTDKRHLMYGALSGSIPSALLAAYYTGDRAKPLRDIRSVELDSEIEALRKNPYAYDKANRMTELKERKKWVDNADKGRLSTVINTALAGGAAGALLTFLGHAGSL